MKRGMQQAATMAAACFRPTAPHTVSGAAAYGTYLAWVVIGLAEKLGTTVFVHLLFSVATLGIWVGTCVGRVRAWPNAGLVPGYQWATTVSALCLAFSGLGCNVAAAWFGGLDLWPFAALGILAISASMIVGLLLPGGAVYGQLAMWLVAIPWAFWSRDTVRLEVVLPPGAWVAGAVVGGGLLSAFAFAGRSGRPTWLSSGRLSPVGIFQWRLLWEPSFARVAWVFGLLAVLAAAVRGADVVDEMWVVVIGSLCVATAGATGGSFALPHGTLPRASRMLLLGAANRAGVGRRVQRKILGDMIVATAVFTAAVAALGADGRLVEMVLVGFACSNVYAAFAARSRWLMASRLSVLVSAPVVAAMAIVAWEIGLQGLPAAAGAWIASAVAAVVVGGMGIGRLNLDLT